MCYGHSISPSSLTLPTKYTLVIGSMSSLCFVTYYVCYILNDVHAARSLTPRKYVILYADDILLIALSIGELQSLFHVCEIELNWLDMSIDEKKSCCIRIGPRSAVLA